MADFWESMSGFQRGVEPIYDPAFDVQRTIQRKSMNVNRFLFALLFVTAFASARAGAQTTWIESTSDGPQVNLEWAKPSFDEPSNETFFTSRLLLSGQYPISDAARLVADLPVAHFGADGADASSTKLGNPYLGVRYRFSPEGAVGGGVRLPVADVDDFVDGFTLLTGGFSDLRRTEAFTQEAFSARSYVERTFQPGENVSLRVRPGMTVLVPSGDERRDSQALLDYSGQIWYHNSQIRTGLGIGGRTNLTEDEGALGDRSIFFLNAVLQARFERVRPGVVFRVPLSDEVSSIVDYAVGVTVAVGL